MRHGDGAVGQELHFLLEGVLVLGELGGLLFPGSRTAGHSFSVLTILAVLGGRLAILGGGFLFRVGLSDSLLEALVGLLEEGEMVVERLHVERAVDGDLTIVRNGVAQRCAILLLTTTHPVIGCGVADVRIEPVEDRQLVQWHLIRGRERLTVVQRTTEMLDAGPYRVFPSFVAVGIEVFVDGLVAVGLLNLCLCARLEVHVQVLGEVPAHGEVAVPQNLRAEGGRQRRTTEVVHVALLQFIIGTRDIRIERNVLW